MTTIAQQLVDLESAVSNNDVQTAQELINTLTARRLKPEQKQALADLQDKLAANDGEEGEDEAFYSMSAQLRKYRSRYKRSIAGSGAKSLNNGDLLAQYLEHRSEIEVMKLADEFAPIDGMTHAQKYAGLNRGQQRMNAGNKLRARIKKGEIEIEVQNDLPIQIRRVAG